MISTVNYSNYNKIFRMTSTINNFVNQAITAKSQITGNISSVIAKSGVGENVDMFV